MSLLNAVLQEAGKATTEEYNKHRNNLLPKIKDTHERVQMLSWALQEHINDTYLNFIETKSLEQINYKYRKENIYVDVENAQEGIQNLQQRFTTFDNDFSKICTQLQDSFNFLKNLCLVVEGKRKLEQADHEFNRYNYSEAMLSISELIEKLNNIKFDGKLAKALSNMIAQAETQYSLYSANVSLEWEDIFSWSEQTGVYHIIYSLSVQQSDTTVIKNVLKTLFATDRLNFELGAFSEFFLTKVLHKIIRHNCEIFTEDVIAPNHTIVFNIKIDLEDSSVPTYQSVFTNLMAVFDFLQSTLGTRLECDDQTFIGVFANSIRSKFFDKIIEDCIRNNLPSCDSSYENYKNLVLELDTFNKFLIELKFVNSEDSPLNSFVKDTECVLYKKKCDKLLSEVRELLNESLSYGTTTVGTIETDDNESIIDCKEKSIWELEKPLYLPQCVISSNVQKILQKIIEYLEESVKLPERYGNKLVNYIKNIAILYQCIVPKKFKINLEHCPLDIALFFNNCFYLAHGLIGPPWKTMLPQTFADQLTMVLLESVQDLRVLGLEKMSLYLQSQKTNIGQSVNPDDFQSWTEETYEQFDCAINEALTLMRDLKRSWHDILPRKMYELSMCTLIQALCAAILDRMFSNNSVIEEILVYKIAVRLDGVIEEIAGLFKGLKQAINTVLSKECGSQMTVASVIALYQNLSPEQTMSSFVLKSVANNRVVAMKKKMLQTPMDFDMKVDVWSKFKKLPQMLKAQLLEISRLWKSDKQLSHSYTCEEVRQLIKMRFPDDKFRLKILVDIQ